MSLELFMKNADHEIIQKPHMKICTKCKTPKPATTEYFYFGKNAKDGLDSSCKECKRIQRRDHYQRGGREQNRVYMENGGREKYYKTRHEKSPHRHALNALRNRAKKRGKRKFLLGEAKSPEAEAYIEYLQTITHCPDCSKEMVWLSEVINNPDSASFDRIDSDEHYAKENVRIVCFRCNTQKQDSPVDEWVGLLKVRVEKGIIEEVDPKLIEFLSEEQSLKKG